jgi:hypothetical protein
MTCPHHSRQRAIDMVVGVTSKNRIMIHGPKADGTYAVEFRTDAGDVLTISIPRTETPIIRHFQERMPHGLFVLDVTAF